MYPKPRRNVERFRIRDGRMATGRRDGNNGAFVIPYSGSVNLIVIASNGKGWEHVSVRADESGLSRVPTWEEMCFIKERFWQPEEVVVQYHPARSQYVNMHPHVLHLWRSLESELPTPPGWMVGFNDARDLERKLEQMEAGRAG